MFSMTTLGWAVLAVLAFNAEATHFEGRTIGDFTESLQRAASDLCARRAGLSLDSVDPLSLGTFTVRAGEFVLKNRNVAVKGFGKAAISNLKWLFNENRGSAQVSANFTMTSDYDAAGKFLYLPMSSSGKLNLYAYDVNVDVTFNFRKVLIDSIEYLEIYNLKSVPSFGLLQFNIKSDGSCSAADTLVNAALNANWRMLEAASTAQVSGIVDQKMEAEFNTFSKKVPFSEFFNYIQ